MVPSIKTKITTPKMVSGSLKAASECNTFVEGRPPKYAAKKIPTNTVPTP